MDYGTITYTLSTYFWKEQKVVPAVDGTFNLFNINIGDKFKSLTVDNRNNTMVLQASANVYKKVPSSTFNDYANNQYTKERDLWNSVNQITPFISSSNIKTNSDIAIPSIFISTAYTLTGSNIFIQLILLIILGSKTYAQIRIKYFHMILLYFIAIKTQELIIYHIVHCLKMVHT